MSQPTPFSRLVQRSVDIAQSYVKGGLKVQPMRPWSDAVGSAHFEVPSFDPANLQKRVVSNLTYYQTNYILVYGVAMLLAFFYRPAVLGLLGCILVSALFVLLLIKLSMNNEADLIKENMVPIAVIQVFLLFMMWYLGRHQYKALSWFLFVPTLASLGHMLFRNPSMSNKLHNATS